jgi:hypothetical protein
MEGGERWMVVLGGAGRDYPPTDDEGFQAFMRSLPDQAIYEAIQHERPRSPIYGYRTDNRFRHYERLARVPEGLVVRPVRLIRFMARE